MQDKILNHMVIGDGHSLRISLVDTIHREYDEVRSWGSQSVLLLLADWNLSDHHLHGNTILFNTPLVKTYTGDRN